MPRSKGAKPSSQEQRHRETSARGLLPIQIWVPDVRSAAFKREAHRQSLAVSKGGRAHDNQAFIDAASDWQAE
ncbi:antitoxin MazE family protein [Reyranella aquatilis]|uniref:Antitoxin MazE family protein n=1 Tax=Reyranella aquatilis TaxID=2035356 RepID=A0ABS8L2D9_9HYPH|nr:antitoxin MazE family protein [Reyranella aquatilis]MCC8432471.1 antitoxin MazE family protein [Reyranella aquatilis]